MRCDTCNRRLNDYECSLKSVEFGVYMNTCQKCLHGLGIEVTGNSALAPTTPIEDELSPDLEADEISEQDITRLLYTNPMEDE